MDLLHAIEDAANKTYTENGAVTLETTGDCCLDLFATVGALRHVSEEEICLRFQPRREGRFRGTPCLPCHHTLAGRLCPYFGGQKYQQHSGIRSL